MIVASRSSLVSLDDESEKPHVGHSCHNTLSHVEGLADRLQATVSEVSPMSMMMQAPGSAMSKLHHQRQPSSDAQILRPTNAVQDLHQRAARYYSSALFDRTLAGLMYRNQATEDDYRSFRYIGKKKVLIVFFAFTSATSCALGAYATFSFWLSYYLLAVAGVCGALAGITYLILDSDEYLSNIVQCASTRGGSRIRTNQSDATSGDSENRIAQQTNRIEALCVAFCLCCVACSLQPYPQNHLCTERGWFPSEVLNRCTYMIAATPMAASAGITLLSFSRAVVTCSTLLLVPLVLFLPRMFLYTSDDDWHSILPNVVVQLCGTVACSAVSILKDLSVRRYFEDQASLVAASREIEGITRTMDATLNNFLPRTVWSRLDSQISGPRVIGRRNYSNSSSSSIRIDAPLILDVSSEASVATFELVDFERWSTTVLPAEVADVVAFLFVKFDELSARHRCDRVKVLGDSYTVVAGLLPVGTAARDGNSNNAYESTTPTGIVDFAIEQRQLVEVINLKLTNFTTDRLRCAIGLHCGTLAGAVFQRSFLSYEVMGPANERVAQLLSISAGQLNDQIAVSSEIATKLHTHNCDALCGRSDAHQTVKIYLFQQAPILPNSNPLPQSPDAATAEGVYFVSSQRPMLHELSQEEIEEIITAQSLATCPRGECWSRGMEADDAPSPKVVTEIVECRTRFGEFGNPLDSCRGGGPQSTVVGGNAPCGPQGDGGDGSDAMRRYRLIRTVVSSSKRANVRGLPTVENKRSARVYPSLSPSSCGVAESAGGNVDASEQSGDLSFAVPITLPTMALPSTRNSILSSSIQSRSHNFTHNPKSSNSIPASTNHITAEEDVSIGDGTGGEISTSLRRPSSHDSGQPANVDAHRECDKQEPVGREAFLALQGRLYRSEPSEDSKDLVCEVAYRRLANFFSHAVFSDRVMEREFHHFYQRRFAFHRRLVAVAMLAFLLIILVGTMLDVTLLTKRLADGARSDRAIVTPTVLFSSPGLYPCMMFVVAAAVLVAVNCRRFSCLFQRDQVDELQAMPFLENDVLHLPCGERGEEQVEFHNRQRRVTLLYSIECFVIAAISSGFCVALSSLPLSNFNVYCGYFFFICSILTFSTSLYAKQTTWTMAFHGCALVLSQLVQYGSIQDYAPGFAICVALPFTAIATFYRELYERDHFAALCLCRGVLQASEEEQGLLATLLATLLPTAMIPVALNRVRNRTHDDDAATTTGPLLSYQSRPVAHFYDEICVAEVRVDHLVDSFCSRQGPLNAFLRAERTFRFLEKVLDEASLQWKHEDGEFPLDSIQRVCRKGDSMVFAGPLVCSPQQDGAEEPATKKDLMPQSELLGSTAAVLLQFLSRLRSLSAPSSVHGITSFSPYYGGMSGNESPSGALLQESDLPSSEARSMRASQEVSIQSDLGGGSQFPLGSITCVVGCGGGVGALFGDHTLTFTLLGTAARQASGLMRAAPSGFIGVTESFVRLAVNHDIDVVDVTSGKSNIGPAEKWRVRGLGTQIVFPICARVAGA